MFSSPDHQATSKHRFNICHTTINYTPLWSSLFQHPSFVFIPRKHQHSPPTHESAYISQTNKIRIIVVSISHKQLGIRLFYAETDLQHIIRKYPPKPLPSINTVLVPYQFWESLKITRNTRLLDCNHHCFTYSELMIFKLEIPGKQSQQYILWSICSPHSYQLINFIHNWLNVTWSSSTKQNHPLPIIQINVNQCLLIISPYINLIFLCLWTLPPCSITIILIIKWNTKKLWYFTRLTALIQSGRKRLLREVSCQNLN